MNTSPKIKKKVLTYLGYYVDLLRLPKGIYDTSNPVLLPKDITLDEVVDKYSGMGKEAIENIRKCTLTDIEIDSPKKIDINYNPDEEMMQISFNGKVVFYGNYWDFKKDPHSIRDFLTSLNLDVSINNDLSEAG